MHHSAEFPAEGANALDPGLPWGFLGTLPGMPWSPSQGIPPDGSLAGSIRDPRMRQAGPEGWADGGRPAQPPEHGAAAAVSYPRGGAGTPLGAWMLMCAAAVEAAARAAGTVPFAVQAGGEIGLVPDGGVAKKGASESLVEHRALQVSCVPSSVNFWSSGVLAFRRLYTM